MTKTTIRRPLSRHRRHERSGYEGGVQLHDVAFSSLLTNSISLANTKPTEFRVCVAVCFTAVVDAVVLTFGRQNYLNCTFWFFECGQFTFEVLYGRRFELNGRTSDTGLSTYPANLSLPKLLYPLPNC